jgi:hypothetical protein
MAWFRALGLLVAAVLQLLPLQASAHLMMPQRGTLNFVDGGAYLVLSLPVSAFPYTDERGDHLLSQQGFAKYQKRMTEDIEAHVQLRDAQGPLQLEGTFLNFTPPDNDANGSAAQVVVLGRFKLRQPDDVNRAALRLRITLFGSAADEQSVTATVTRVNPQTKQKERQLLVLSATQPERVIFASTWSVLVDYVRLGMEHILTGFDHLVFLLVVLAATVGWRHVLLALTCFTVGHAITLTLSLMGGIKLSSVWVEPAIALTIVGVALWDLWARKRHSHIPQGWRLAVVFACSLVHGLGLASSLESLGLDREHLLASLVGFNSGIELGQVLVGLCLGLLVIALQRLTGPKSVHQARTLAGFAAVGLGGFWFLQRVLGL